MPETNHDPAWLPLDLFLQQEGLTAEDLLRAERAGAELPVVDLGPGRMVVERRRVYDWRQLAELLGALPVEKAA